MRGALNVGSLVSATIQGDVVDSLVWARDDNLDVVVLAEPNASARNFSFVPIPSLQSIAVRKPTSTVSIELPESTEAQLTSREKSNVEARRLASLQLGKYVTPQAQAIYDELSRTMACQWREKTIVVHDDVVITAPYRTENCTGLKSKKTQHVIKVLIKARKKLRLN